MSIYMESMVALIDHIHENAGPAEAKLHWSSICTNTCTQMCRITRLGWSGGMLPQEKFWKFDALRWLLRPKNITWKSSLQSWHGNRIRFTTTRMEIVSIVIGSFRYTRWTGRRSSTRKPVNICYSGSYSKQHPAWMCGYPAHNLLVLRSPQFSFMFGPRSSCGHKSVLAICVFLAYKLRVANIISVKTLVR